MAEPFVIDDTNWNTPAVQHPIVNGERKNFGYRGMWEPGCRSPKTFADLESVPMIPSSEWPDRIRENERDGTTLMQFSKDMGLPCLDQNRTNYCWINGPVHCCEIIRLQETGRVHSLSPASAGARIKNFRNVGGWGSQGLEFMRQHGVNYTEDWPPNAINRSYLTDSNIEKAKLNITLEYFKLDSWAEVASCLLAGIPVAVGYNWWSHEVTAVDLVLEGSSVELRIRNSWGMGWGDMGFGILKGSRKIPNDAVATVSMMPL